MNNRSLPSPEILENLWRTSPALTARELSKHDKEPWIPAPHLLIVSKLIRDAVTGNGPNQIMVNMPPRHGKSQLVSRWTPLWFLDNWPSKFVMLCGYGANFASEWGRLVRNESVRFKDRLRFGLAEDSKASNKWKTVQMGGMFTAGMGGDITGRGAHLMVIDDPVKNKQEADSRQVRQSVWDWWSSTARTRLEPGGVILMVMTRWHEDDLGGRMLNPKWNDDYANWHVVSMPAIYEGGEPDPLKRTPGQALWPMRYDEEAMARLKRSVTEEDWLALYQQKPASLSRTARAYHTFDPDRNVVRCEYDPNLPMFWSLDFNVDPMCSVYGQVEKTRTARTHLTGERQTYGRVLGELALPNSNTREALQAFVERMRPYCARNAGKPIKLDVYMDASSNQRSTNASETDVQIIKDFLRRYPEFSVTYHVSKKNPRVKDRVNSVCYAFRDSEGFARLFVDPQCETLIKDCSRVKWKLDSGGNSLGVLEKSDPSLTHASDALGYVMEREFPLSGTAGDELGILQ
jgi:hypothetical protein